MDLLSHTLPLNATQTRVADELVITGRYVHVGTFRDGAACVEARSGHVYTLYAVGKRGKVQYLYSGTRG